MAKYVYVMLDVEGSILVGFNQLRKVQQEKLKKGILFISIEVRSPIKCILVNQNILKLDMSNIITGLKKNLTMQTLIKLSYFFFCIVQWLCFK